MVGAEVAFVGLYQQAVQAVEDHAAGLVAVYFRSCGGDEFLRPGGVVRDQPFGENAFVVHANREDRKADVSPSQVSRYPSAIRRIFAGRLKRFEVGTTHREALDPRNPVFANYLLRCVGQIREAAQTEASSAAGWPQQSGLP